MSTTPYLIPLTNTNQSLSVTLAGVQYQLRVIWNAINESWTLDISDSSGNAILTGIPLVTGVDLLGQFGYLNFGGQLIVQSANDPDLVPGFTELGETGFVYFVVDNG
jgi:hypothetical protein